MIIRLLGTRTLRVRYSPGFGYGASSDFGSIDVQHQGFENVFGALRCNSLEVYMWRPRPEIPNPRTFCRR